MGAIDIFFKIAERKPLTTAEMDELRRWTMGVEKNPEPMAIQNTFSALKVKNMLEVLGGFSIGGSTSNITGAELETLTDSSIADSLHSHSTVLAVNASTITTGNLTCAETNQYNCTIAGLTANRNAVLPAPSAAGKYIRINILDGDDTYFLIIIGDTGVTINGGSAATEYIRLQSKNRSITLMSTSTSNWMVIAGAEVMTVSVGPYTVIPYSASPSYMQAMALPGPVNLVKVIYGLYVATTNDANSYWSIALGGVTGGTTYATLNTSALSPDTWSTLSTTSFSPTFAPVSDVGLITTATKAGATGTPGNMNTFCTLQIIPC